MVAFCQNATTEATIKSLEEKQVQAILQKDTATLRKIWSPGFMVNSPRNIIVIGGQIERVVEGSLAYTSYTFTMEQMLVQEDMVVTMGSETVIPVIANPKGGQTIKRRYTQVWQKANDSWILIARHANELCQQ